MQITSQTNHPTIQPSILLFHASWTDDHISQTLQIFHHKMTMLDEFNGFPLNFHYQNVKKKPPSNPSIESTSKVPMQSKSPAAFATSPQDLGGFLECWKSATWKAATLVILSELKFSLKRILVIQFHGTSIGFPLMKGLIRPLFLSYFWGGYIRGGWLISHKW